MWRRASNGDSGKQGEKHGWRSGKIRDDTEAQFSIQSCWACHPGCWGTSSDDSCGLPDALWKWWNFWRGQTDLGMMRAGKSVDTNKRATGWRRINRPMVSITHMRSYLSRESFTTHCGLQGGKRWHKGDTVFIKGTWVGRSETSDEHIVLTPGGRLFSRTIRRLEPSRRHDAGFLGKVKGFPWTVLSGVDQERNLHHHHERTLRATIPTCQKRLSVCTVRRPRRQTTRVILTMCLWVKHRCLMVAMQATSSPSHQWIQPMECDSVWSLMVRRLDDSRSQEVQGDCQESNALPGESPEEEGAIPVRFFPLQLLSQERKNELEAQFQCRHCKKAVDHEFFIAGVGQQRQQVSELQFDKFPTLSTF